MWPCTEAGFALWNFGILLIRRVELMEIIISSSYNCKGFPCLFTFPHWLKKWCQPSERQIRNIGNSATRTAVSLESDGAESFPQHSGMTRPATAVSQPSQQKEVLSHCDPAKLIGLVRSDVMDRRFLPSPVVQCRRLVPPSSSPEG